MMRARRRAASSLQPMGLPQHMLCITEQPCVPDITGHSIVLRDVDARARMCLGGTIQFHGTPLAQGSLSLPHGPVVKQRASLHQTP